MTLKILSSVLVYTFLSFWSIKGQQVQSPQEFLGYGLGERFTPHHLVADYFQHIADHSPWVKLQQYGETYEHRPLLTAFISDPKNLQQLEAIRTSNINRTGITTGEITHQIPVVWLSYNVHGNESVSTEAALRTLFELISNPKVRGWLENTLVIIDPCVNPDGRDRYVNWYNQIAHQTSNPNKDDLEHHEPWPNGRTNHYLFDLNRDWAWQTQQESKQRMAIYNRWMPQVHVDFHEQGVNEPYFFAPAAEPYHPLITPWQREFQTLIGRNHAKYFDQAGWLYFTKEVFDLFYPSYGDTYPMFNGAIGMTYEQGGSGDAGLRVIKNNKDTLTLVDRIEHHFVTGLSTIEMTSNHAVQLLSEFEQFFENSQTNPQGLYKSYVIKGTNDPKKLDDLMHFLDSQSISYGVSDSHKTYRAFNYLNGSTANFSLEPNDLVISVHQPKSVLTQALFDPEPRLSDSLTYDITSWALPYQYDLQAYALADRITVKPYARTPSPDRTNAPEEEAYAYISPWKNLKDARWLGHLLQNGYQVRFAEEPFTMNNQGYDRGTLVITRADNGRIKDFDHMVTSSANQYDRSIKPVTGGWVQSGKDLGSDAFRLINPPNIALITGDPAQSLSFGELWYYLEQDLHYPVTIIDNQYLNKIDLSKYQIILLPSGKYQMEDKLKAGIIHWVKSGGRLILVQNAMETFVDQEGIALKKDSASDESQIDADIKVYGERERKALSSRIPGAIFKVKMDNSHPLGFGYNTQYFSLKTSDLSYPLLIDQWNVGTITDPRDLVSGFAGFEALQKQKNTMVFGVEDLEKGHIIYFVDNPLFRAFWYQGKLIMANALFFVGQ